jgi:hypothetical protein
MLASGRTAWSTGERVRVYRTESGTGGVVTDPDEAGTGAVDARNYDVEHYVRVLRDTFAARLARALTLTDFDAVFADPVQLNLFAPALATIRTVLTTN